MFTLSKFTKCGVIAILRGISNEHLPDLVQAISKGGINNIEIPLIHTDEASLKYSIAQIKALSGGFPSLNIGAGTVLTAEQVNLAANAGAKYIISPNTKKSVITEAKRLQLVSVPGALTPTEIAQAYEFGADLVKVFPANNMGAGYFKAIKAPLKHIPLVAVGGINVKNAAEYFMAGACCIGAGGALSDYNNLEGVTEAAELLCEAAKYRV